MFLAATIAGLIEVEDRERGRTWFATDWDDPEVASLAPKTIGTTAEWFERNDATTEALIVDVDDHGLVYGASAVTRPASCETSVFGAPFWKYFPYFRDAERRVCELEGFHLEFADRCEQYVTATASWIAVGASGPQEDALIRARDRYSGFSYFVIRPEMGLRFRINHPEWAFVAARHILGWQIDELVRIDGHNLRIPRRVRLPTLLLRYLFTSSKRVRIGPFIEFYDMDDQAVKGLRRFILSAGEQNAA
jgi:hypothetical protein